NLATALQTYGRLLVIYDKQPNGALPTYATVMQTRNSAGTASNTAFSDPNFDNKERFTILRDITMVLPSVTNTAGVLTNIGFDQQSKNDINAFNIDIYIKLKGLHTAYTGATAGIADISTGKPPAKKQQQKRKRPTQFAPVPQIYRRGPRMEIKYCDIAASDDNFNLVGGTPWVLLNGVVQGAGNNQRIGNKISMKALRMKGQIINLATALQTYGRLLVIYDKQPNGALPTYATVMQTRNSAGT
ncbi:unnamed protein product, partial [Rotaria socialis]